MKNGRCQDDSCDLSHCISCGCHMAGQYLPPGTVCDSCQLELDAEMEAVARAVPTIKEYERQHELPAV